MALGRVSRPLRKEKNASVAQRSTSALSGWVATWASSRCALAASHSNVPSSTERWRRSRSHMAGKSERTLHRRTSPP